MRKNSPVRLIYAALWVILSWASWSLSGNLAAAILAGAILATILLIPATILVAGLAAPFIWIRDLIASGKRP